jgi:hypothetical protein
MENLKDDGLKMEKVDEVKIINDLHEKAQGEPEKTPNTPEMIKINDRVLEEAKKSEFSHYAFKRDIFNKAEDLFGKSSGGFVQEIDHCLGYSAMKGKMEKVTIDNEGTVGHETVMKDPLIDNNINVHENVTKEQVKKDILDLLDGALRVGNATAQSISDYDADKVEAFRSFIKDLN